MKVRLVILRALHTPVATVLAGQNGRKQTFRAKRTQANILWRPWVPEVFPWSLVMGEQRRGRLRVKPRAARSAAERDLAAS
jgi:hypothetical protein